MEQPQFRVKFPLGTKLALSMVILITLLVGFLSYSAVHIVTEDKQAYTYQLQSMQAYLGGREFTERVRVTLDGLRLYLSGFDPRQPVTPEQSNILQTAVNTQSDSPLYISLLLKTDTGEAKILTTHLQGQLAEQMGVQAERLTADLNWLKPLIPGLLKNSYAFLNLAGPGMPAVMAVVYADLGLKDLPEGMPVAVSYVALSKIVKARHTGELLIAQDDGSVLYSSEPSYVLNHADVSAWPLFTMAKGAQIGAGTKEYDLEGKTYLGAFERTSIGPIVIAQVEWKKAMAAAYKLRERLILLGLISISVAVLFAIIFSNRITAPIKRLFQATRQVMAGDFNVDPKVRTRDEVGELSVSFVAMSKKIQELIVESVKGARLEEELKVAATVQETLMPPEKFADDRIEIVSHYQSASQCGGDWWGFFRVGSKICIMIADATGHGVPSALVTASARSCFSVLHKLAKETPGYELSPGLMMSYANKVVFDAASTKIMMTFFIGVIDLEAMTVTYANAGHNPPWLFSPTGEHFVLKSLVPKGTRLGEVEDSGIFAEMSCPIHPNDLLVLYTDGLMENTNLQGEQYGKRRARQKVEEHLAKGPNGVISSLVTDMDRFGAGKPYDDDVTLAVLRVIR